MEATIFIGEDEQWQDVVREVVRDTSVQWILLDWSASARRTSLPLHGAP